MKNDVMDRRAYRRDVRIRAELYRRALDSIPERYLPRDDPQRQPISRDQGHTLYYKLVENAIEDIRAKVIWYCSYVAAGAYSPTSTFQQTVLNDPYERFSDRRWIGMLSNGKVVATARALMADSLGRFQIHDDKTGFGPLSLPSSSIYGQHLPVTSDDIAATREVSAFAVDLDARSWQRNALVGLVKFLLNDFQDTGIRHVYSSIDESFFLLINHMGLRLEQVGKKNCYMGTVTVPAFFVVDKIIDNLRPAHQSLYSFIRTRVKFPSDSKYAFFRCGSP